MLIFDEVAVAGEVAVVVGTVQAVESCSNKQTAWPYAVLCCSPFGCLERSSELLSPATLCLGGLPCWLQGPCSESSPVHSSGVDLTCV